MQRRAVIDTRAAEAAAAVVGNVVAGVDDGGTAAIAGGAVRQNIAFETDEPGAGGVVVDGTASAGGLVARERAVGDGRLQIAENGAAAGGRIPGGLIP